MSTTASGVGQADRASLCSSPNACLAFVMPFTIWTLRGFIGNVPKDLPEAAMIDGCSQGQAFRKILFPLIAPGLVSTSVFAVIMAGPDPAQGTGGVA